MAEITIERLTEVTPAAVSQLAALVVQLSKSPQPLDEARLGQIIAATGALYVARDGDTIVGTVYRVDMHHLVRSKSWLEDLVVDENYRGQGIARRLMERAIGDTPPEMVSINLNSKLDRVDSHKLYEKLGFEVREDTRIWRRTLH
ncbi:MAG TPA: GNAT family N-acetyltransferase [Candidatus Saccharimonadia bacterium]|nr:GNAT family N-acetyltransferase [Candidatus Saccharimonadia bacterium]